MAAVLPVHSTHPPLIEQLIQRDRWMVVNIDRREAMYLGEKWTPGDQRPTPTRELDSFMWKVLQPSMHPLSDILLASKLYQDHQSSTFSALSLVKTRASDIFRTLRDTMCGALQAHSSSDHRSSRPCATSSTVSAGEVREPDRCSERRTDLTSLPEDIIRCIFDAIEKLRDATSLSLTNSQICALGSSRIKYLTASEVWSGDRLILLHGVPAVDDPLPAALLEDPLLTDTHLNGDFAGLVSTCHPCGRPALIQPSILQTHPGFNWGKFGGVSLHYYPSPHLEPWVAYNLSRREYICVRVVIQRLPLIEPGTDVESILMIKQRLQEALLHPLTDRLRWASNHKGAWAGDRIKVCTLAVAKAEIDDWGSWTDVTRPEERMVSST